MTDEELVVLNQKGFIPGPDEPEEQFLSRVKENKKEMVKLGGRPLPEAHWKWTRVHLKEIFDFEPDSLPVFYSNRLLTPWQGAVSWILNGKLIAIQMREKLATGSYLGIYDRDEILAHEAVHAARCAFNEKENEEFFAYLTSRAKWRRVFGPIVREPWEVWPFLGTAALGIFFPAGFLIAALWAGFGFIRLIRQHRRLQKAAHIILQAVHNERKTRAILLRLTDREIRSFAKFGNFLEYAKKEPSLRWRLIRLAYF